VKTETSECGFGDVRISDRVRKTVPCGRTLSGKNPAAIRADLKEKDVVEKQSKEQKGSTLKGRRERSKES